ncbi:MAG: TetR/AcrR family transcriptional regulator [Anaerolineaceae bacterium]|nr:MAG: TetR/AcrR family transcriptional regulator [Anaerolineaceae bacterium]
MLNDAPTPPQETRERILEAAVNVFASKGYHDTKVDDIVAESQTSKGSFYFYFPSKQDIFLALVDTFADLLESRLRARVQAETSGVARVDLALRVCLETFGQYRGLAKIALVQATGLGHVFEEKRRSVNDRFIAFIKKNLDEAVTEGGISALDTDVAACAWMGALNEIVLRWVYTGQPDPVRALPSLRRLLLQSVGIPEEKIREYEEKS